ncbi:hypothetical protein [Edaphobacter sp. DSM 109919]|uniref:Zf-HC2 domain-containing protein n=1 Tax=Edaphobacter paludis TaxID=3035702 RepID=A0AAU7CYJ6_9BACT
MNRSGCECEREVVDALRTGLWTADLNGHIESCDSCRETKRVAESLLHYAASLRVEQVPAAADEIWRRAQMERQAMILKRATRPLIFMRLLSLGCVVAFAAWLLHGLSRFDYREILHGWALGDILPGVAIAVLCIAAGAFYMLHEGKQQGAFNVVS